MIEPAFLSDLEVRWLPDSRWQLVAELRYRSAVAGALIVVPAGFVTDFASVPRLPVVYLLTGNTAHRPAVVHDFLYQTHVVSKAMADDVFAEAMQVDGVDVVRRNIMTEAVELFGERAWEGSDGKRERLNPDLAAAKASGDVGAALPEA